MAGNHGFLCSSTLTILLLVTAHLSIQCGSQSTLSSMGNQLMISAQPTTSAIAMASAYRMIGISKRSESRSKRFLSVRILYTHNGTSSFHPERKLLISGDIEMNPGPNHVAPSNPGPRLPKRCHSVATIPSSMPLRSCHPGNLITVKRMGMSHYMNRATQLSLCCLNVRSLRNKSAAFVDLVCDCNADLFTLTETWLTDNDSAVLNEITPSGYKLYHCPRTDRSGGGTALLFRDCINVSKVFSAEKASFEVSEWLVSVGFMRLRVIVVYRPPYSAKHPVTTGIFIDEFTDYLESTVMSSEPLLISGDFNIHMDVLNDADSMRFKDLLDSMGLIQHMKEPTHELGHTLDLIITRQSDDIIAAPPRADRMFSDHAALLCRLKTARPAATVKRTEFRRLKSIVSDKFVEDIRNSRLCQEPPEDLDTLVNCYNKTLASVLDKHAPTQSRNITIRPRAPWFNAEVKQARRERRRAERRWRSTKLQSDLAAFKILRNYATHVMNMTRCEYYKKFVDDNSSDQAKLFKASKSLLNLQADKALPPHTDAFTLANEMGEFFVQKIITIRSKLANDRPVHSCFTPVATVGASSDIVFSEFKTLSEEAVRNVIVSSNKKTCALDPLPSSLLPVCLDVLLPVITKMINLSLESGHFAEDWKNALVNPLLKKAGLELINKNFRPISNLQFVSKLTERVVASQIQAHMLANNLSPVLQSAYRKHHSTETALLKVKNDLLMNMNKGHVTLLVLLDLSAAFDTVDHKILLQRLQSMLGMRGTALSWFRSYLEGRSQQVSINGTLSRRFELSCGVPQGSCLGPLLFTIYFSKLFDILKFHLPTAHVYADDTQLYLSFSPNDRTSEVEAVSTIENCIKEIRRWMTVDNLKLNDDKTEFLLIGTRRQLTKVSIESIKVGDVDVAPVPIARNLGSWFDSHLDMTTHINRTCGSAFFYLYNIRHIRKYLSKEITVTLVHSFITSRLDYCNSLLYGLPDYQIRKLQRVMNASARLVCCAPKFCHITPILYDLHWLPVRKRIEFKILLITFKILHGLAPKYLQDLVSVMPASTYSLRRNNNGILLAWPSVKSKKTMGDRAFLFAAPTLWNNLPAAIRSTNSLEPFKREIKTFLFLKSFS